MKCDRCPKIQAVGEDWGIIKKNGKLLVLCLECAKKEEDKQGATSENHNSNR